MPAHWFDECYGDLHPSRIAPHDIGFPRVVPEPGGITGLRIQTWDAHRRYQSAKQLAPRSHMAAQC